MANHNNSGDESQQAAVGIIYLIVCLVTGKKYVGKTKRKLSQRIYEHRRDSKTAKIGIAAAIRVHGWVNFTVEVLETCPVELLNERERFWIRELNTKAPNGYNLTDGGDGNSNPSEETRARMSANHADVSGEKNPNYGKPRSAETKAKIIAHLPDMRGEKNPHYGKHHSPETKARISAMNSGENHPNYGKPSPRKGKKCSLETKAKMSAAHMGKPSPNKGKPSPRKGQKCSPETCAKISAARKGKKGKPRSPETKAKIAASVRATLAKKKLESQNNS